MLTLSLWNLFWSMKMNGWSAINLSGGGGYAQRKTTKVSVKKKYKNHL